MNTKVGSIDEEFNRMLDSFSSLIKSQQKDLSRGMAVLSRAFERAVQRFSDAIANTPGVTTGGSSGTEQKTASSGSGGTSANTGVMLVRIVNSDSEAVPVRKVESNTFGSVFGGIMGGIGSFLGNLFGGLASGFMSPVTAIITGTQMVIMLGEIIAIVAKIRDLVRFLIGGLAWFLQEFFGHLYQAGLLPVSRLIAALLLLIDYGVAIVLRHITPYLDWVSRLIDTLLNWVGRFVDRLANWLQRLLNRLGDFLGNLIDYLIDRVIRKMMELALGAAGVMFNVLKLAGEHIVHSLATAFNNLITGLLSGLFGVMRAAGAVLRVAGEHIRFAIIEAINGALSRLGFSPITNPAPSNSISGAASSAFTAGQREGAGIAAGLHITTTSPSQTFAEAARTGFDTGRGTASGRSTARALADLITGPLQAPRINVPGFASPELTLPEVPEPSPQLRQLLEEEGARNRVRQEGAAVRESGVTVNGDVNVQIRADTLDMENSEQVARNLVEQIMEELRRLSRQEQFSRGLPT